MEIKFKWISHLFSYGRIFNHTTTKPHRRTSGYTALLFFPLSLSYFARGRRQHGVGCGGVALVYIFPAGCCSPVFFVVSIKNIFPAAKSRNRKGKKHKKTKCEAGRKKLLIGNRALRPSVRPFVCPLAVPGPSFNICLLCVVSPANSIFFSSQYCICI